MREAQPQPPLQTQAELNDGASDAKTLVSRDAYLCSGTAIVIANADMKIISANPAYSELTGLMPFELLGTALAVTPHGHQGSDHTSPDGRPQLTNGRWQGEVECRNRQGERITAWMSLVAVTGANGLVRLHVATLVDISALDREREVLRHQAQHDVLTNLPNRRHFRDELLRSTARARRYGKKLALLFIDIDHFKWVNDSLGHGVGDLLLHEVGMRLRRTVRTEDLVARIGGDEFALVLEDLVRPADAGITASAVLNAITQDIELAGHHLRVSASIGIAIFPDDSADSSGLMDAADKAMYRAKETGRSRVVFSHEP